MIHIRYIMLTHMWFKKKTILKWNIKMQTLIDMLLIKKLIN